MAGLFRPTTVLLQSNKTKTANSLRSISSQVSRKSNISAQNGSASYDLSNATTNNSPTSTTTTTPRTPTSNSKMPKPSPLSVLPLSTVVRSLAITTISSSFLLGPSLAIMSLLANSKQPLLMPDRNRLLGWALKKTFYVQFCAGENPNEVRHTIKGLRDLGYKGVILGYAREVVMDDKDTSALKATEDKHNRSLEKEVLPWKKGTLETVELAGPDDFVALKFTGAGSQALYELSECLDPSPALDEAITAICDLALSRGVRLLFDAEQQAIQAGIDSWTLKYMKKYNKNGKACIYGTYQAYLKATPSILSKHLALSQQEGFTLGVKLVRGAYLGSDPRHLINDTKADTDAAYDGITESLIRRSYNKVLKPANRNEKIFPPVDVVLATHNQTSVQKARRIRDLQSQIGEGKIDLVYAQLQGMADEVSCELLQGHEKQGEQTDKSLEVPKAYKYLVWGSTGECMKYLMRRAEENRDAVGRTREGRIAAASEVRRRVKSLFGFS